MPSSDQIRDYLRQGVTMQALLDIDPADLDTVYADACQRFDQEDWLGTKKQLLLLTRLSHWQFDYWLALGLTCQRLGEHEEAALSFSQSARLRIDDPRSAYLAGLSLLALAQPDAARQALDTAIKLCAERPTQQSLKQQAQQMLASCPQERP